ncbi:oligopeptide transport system substrate-binding protein [Terribacillus saccharophilus]|uniref:Oligopeptide transport system substrate-binding protein n=1 Tax=Terribacillus saccharophilus TaxID=361277 RepID=A0A075LNT5_9BACI|nr:peptide ABC transporter substrate-binding protein [Terribacillus goriensis]AIF66073.1 peptide ABC transporter substrate-binding protein [Terribacillus goriensis]SEM89012.1 oligopeptide transport system substrate-binding protein [Terribacillus saccharophilus]
MRKSNWLLLALVLVLSSFLAACSGGSNSSGGSGGGEGSGDSASGSANGDQVYNLTIGDEIPSMDSSLADDQYGIQWTSEIQEGLYRLAEDGSLAEGIATGDPEVSEDGLTWTFTLREDAEWENGDPVTANDFVYAWQRAINPDTGSEYGPYMMGGVIKNATAVNTGEAELDELGVKAVDDYTLEVQLEKPVPYFESLTTFPTFMPLNQKFVEEQGENYALEADNLLSNGPFKMTEWNHGSTMQFVKNDTYWDADTVQLEEINLQVVKDTATGVNLYDTGAVDRTSLTAEFVDQRINDEDYLPVPDMASWYLKLNQNRMGEETPLANENARKAVAQAIDKDGLVNVVLNNGSTVSNGLMPKDFVKGPDGKDFRETNGDLLTYDAEAAKEAWATAKEELGQDEITLEILTGDTDLSTQMVDYLKEQLETNLEGLTVDVMQVPFQQRLDLDTAGDFDIEVSGWGPDYIDPYTFMNLFVTDGENNRMAYSSEEYDSLVEQASTDNATNPEARWQNFLDAEKVLLEDAAIAPLYQAGYSYLQSPKLQGVFSNPAGNDFEYKWAYADNAAAEE